MAKRITTRTKKKAKLPAATGPEFETMLQGLMHYGDIEWQEWSEAVTPESLNARAAFLSGYIFGTALGLALSPRCPHMVEKFMKQYRERGWDV